MKDSKTIINVEDKPQNVLLLLGILVFTVGTFTLNTIISSLQVEVIFLISTNFLFILYYIIKNKGLTVYKLELMWLVFFMYFLFKLLHQNTFLNSYFVDILLFFTLFLFLLLVKLDVKYYKTAMNTMIIISIIYALSTFIQLFNINLYTSLILPRFDSGQQATVMKLYNNDAYSGLTSQTAYIGGYLAYGIALLQLFYKDKTSKLGRGLSIVAIILLLLSLLLTGRRSHLLFLIIALILTYLFSIEIKKFFRQFLKFIFTLIMIIISGVALFSVYKPNIDTPIIGNIYYKMSDTIEGLSKGEDITTGRTVIYDYAIKMFNENPILGIGWREFSHLSGDIFNNEFGSDPHNAYIQLLTELGIVGFILFMIPIIYILFKTIKLLMNAETLFSFDMRWKTVLQFSLFSQLFFILYSSVENSLTSHMYVLIWGFSASITLSAIMFMKRNYNSDDLDSNRKIVNE